MIRKGTYILILEMPDAEIKVGALGLVGLRGGSYCYVGSAMNGLDQRIGRHLSEKKKIRWHIDYLTKECSSIEAYEATHPGTTECGLGEFVQQCGGIPAVKGFGCSDCKCQTHFFFLEESVKERLTSSLFFKKHPCE
jgi:Uri superfamily endonuclease